MYDACYLLGEPKLFKDKFYIYPPKVSDLATNYNQVMLYCQVLTQTQEELNKQAEKNGQEEFYTPFESLLINCYYDEQFRELTKAAIEFLTHEQVLFLFESKAILLGDPQEQIKRPDKTLLTIENYMDFQNEVRLAYAQESLATDDYDPNMDPRLRRMKELRKKRDITKSKAKKDAGETIDFASELVAIFCMNVGLTPLNIGEISCVAMHAITKMYQQKEEYDMIIRSMTSGFGSSKQKTPKYWMRTIK